MLSRITQYKTKQKDELISYLRSVPNVRVTVNDISEHFAKNNITIGTATIYRHLEQMVLEGTVKKYFVDGGSGAYFEYVGRECTHVEQCFYLKCENCGKLVHFHCHELEDLQQHLLEDHGFFINSPKTVFYGVCNDCYNAKI